MSKVYFERRQKVGHIVLADPPSNLVTFDFADGLENALREASKSDIRSLLIRAEGPNFSKGGDVQEFVKKGFDDWRTFISRIHHTYRSIEALQIPTIAAVRGAVSGGAFELTLACDIIVAAENASFRFVEASVGAAPCTGGVQRLAERVGRAYAARYALLSEPMSGVTAGQLGVAAFVVGEDQVENVAEELAIKLSNGPTRSYGAIRALLKAWSGGGVPGADALVLDLTVGLHSTEDARNGRTARAEALASGKEPAPVVFLGK
ncbi:enoyl-CoA hydratase/isomerase family protein [Paraburkholderia elongata]|uniref:Enoyl-CoA hydratase/isomerase family protein n=1 Tax=Paraburkholderia elongata TaxID=2675747 RepID=A0A972NWN1_9BURK|nr:enoyl-CoA hydratase/isomerase family protein [Paraburkholderia elongata]NPT61226.1 enoyl-CoA hydratase/isomerase family protein [Paraburkholderia elongata]